MAKRRIRAAELAGLAALGAFGYNFFGPGRDKKAGERRADVEYRGTDRPPAESVAAPAAPAASLASQIQRPVASFDDGDIGRFADVGSNFNETGQPYDPVGSLAAGASAPAATYRPRPRPFFVNDDSQRRANAAADAMYENRPSAGGRTGVDPTALEGFGVNEVGRGRAPVSRVNASARQYNQDSQGNRAGTQADGGPPITEEMRRNPVARIPGQSAQAPQGGRRVTGNETSRNIQNLLNAPVPGIVPFGRAAGAAGRAASTSREVGSLKETPVTYLGKSGARPVRGPERLEGGRASQPRITDDKASRAAIEAERRKRLGFERKKSEALDESDWTGGAGAYGAKKGGAIKTKKMASGGMSSASKRGDGIATKGKTKCKMY
jgi:hypothetical protein